MSKQIILWRDTPSDVDKGAFNYVASHWKERFICVCLRDYSQERKTCGWDSTDDINYKQVFLESIEDKDEYIKKIIRNDKNTIHVVNGLRSDILKQIEPYFNASTRIIILTERPSYFGSTPLFYLKKILFPILYTYLYFRHNKRVIVLLTYGTKARQFFRFVNFRNVVPFMYTPEIVLPDLSIKRKNIETVRFLYIGRFDCAVKGIDILMKAFDNVRTNKKWQLDLVGGYGKYQQETIEWANNNKNVNYIGSWNQQDITSKMINYDVCLVPSRYDGWNLTPNYALQCEVPIIISDEAGSDELVSNSGGGYIFHSGNINELSSIIYQIIENPSLLIEKRNKIREYKSLTTSESVGLYFIDILNAVIHGEDLLNIKCPWIIKKEK